MQSDFMSKNSMQVLKAQDDRRHPVSEAEQQFKSVENFVGD